MLSICSQHFCVCLTWHIVLSRRASACSCGIMTYRLPLICSITNAIVASTMSPTWNMLGLVWAYLLNSWVPGSRVLLRCDLAYCTLPSILVIFMYSTLLSLPWMRSCLCSFRSIPSGSTPCIRKSPFSFCFLFPPFSPFTQKRMEKEGKGSKDSEVSFCSLFILLLAFPSFGFLFSP